MTPQQRRASIHILHVDGRIDSAGMAVLALASRHLTEVGYQTVARNRHRLARVVQDVEPVLRWRSPAVEDDDRPEPTPD